MKATLEFDLPEEREEHLLALHGLDLALVISDVDDYLRSRLKYGDLDEAIFKALEETRDALHNSMDAHGVSLDLLT